MKTNQGRVFASKEPSPRVEWKSLGHFCIEMLTNKRKDSVVFVEHATGKEWMGAELSERILNVATALVEQHQLQQGSVVTICYEHSVPTTILALAVVSAGGIVSCSSPDDPYAELLYLAKRVEPRLLFCSKDKLDWSEQLTKDLGHPVTGIAMGGQSDGAAPFRHLDHLFNYDRRSSKFVDLVPVACRDISKDIAFITMSSGTTGKPKAVPSTHLNGLMDIGIINNKKRPVARFACTASLDYVSGRLIILSAIGSGSSAVIINKFEPAKMAQAIQEHKINVVFLGAAAFYNLITFEELEKYDISSIMAVFPMGAKIVYLDELREFFGKYPHIVAARQGYGTTETSGLAIKTMTPEEYLLECQCCGQLIAGVRIKLVDPETGELLGVNQQGMLHVQGPSVFPGYYDATLAKGGQSEGRSEAPLIRDSATFDEDGFYITGDIAYFNDEEELFVVGRLKELMSCRGAKKVLPQELEEILGEHPAVSQVCVLGMPNRKELTLHCPRAFVVLKPQYCRGAPVSTERLDPSREAELYSHEGTHKLSSLPVELRRRLAEDIMLFVDDRVSWEKQLTGGIVILDKLPTMLPSGKVNKVYLRSLDEQEVEIYGDRSA